MIKTNYRNPMTSQFQLDYSFYMMFSSYFKKAVCLTENIESRLFLYYAELPMQKQYSLEEKVIREIEKKVLKELAPLDIGEMDVNVRMISTVNGTVFEYFDEGGRMWLRALCRESGHRPKIRIIGTVQYPAE